VIDSPKQASQAVQQRTEGVRPPSRTDFRDGELPERWGDSIPRRLAQARPDLARATGHERYVREIARRGRWHVDGW